jgi:hypothetical protein
MTGPTRRAIYGQIFDLMEIQLIEFREEWYSVL